MKITTAAELAKLIADALEVCDDEHDIVSIRVNDKGDEISILTDEGHFWIVNIV